MDEKLENIVFQNDEEYAFSYNGNEKPSLDLNNTIKEFEELENIIKEFEESTKIIKEFEESTKIIKEFDELLVCCSNDMKKIKNNYTFLKTIAIAPLLLGWGVFILNVFCLTLPTKSWLYQSMQICSN